MRKEAKTQVVLDVILEVERLKKLKIKPFSKKELNLFFKNL
jgi:hypothetical protein